MDPNGGPGPETSSTPAPARPELAVGAVAVRDGHLLMIRRGHEPGAGLWSVPGGRVEAGETLHEAVVREVAEETGLAVEVGRYLGHVERIGGASGGPVPPYHFVILDFAVDVVGAAEPVAGDDADDAVWVPLTGLADVAVVPGLVAFLTDVGVLPD